MAEDALMPLSEGGKLPQVYEIETGQKNAQYHKGDESVDVNASNKMIGLTKEQLEQYRNDPFWKTLRVTLFVLFWLTWIAMFVSAIIIVVLSPKCAEKQQPQWWQKKVSYQLFTPSFADSNGDGIGDLEGIREHLDDLRKIGVQTIWPTPLINSQKDSFDVYDVINHKQVNPQFGTIEDVKKLIAETHDRAMYFVMDFPLTTTSINHSWFITNPDFYVRPKAGERLSQPDSFSNLLNGTYLHYKNKKTWAVLNWAKAKESLIDAAKFWLDLGVDGFHLEFVDYLGITSTGVKSPTEAINALSEFEQALTEHRNSSDQLRDKEIVLFSTIADASMETRLNSIRTAKLNYLINQDLTAISSAQCVQGVAKCLHTAIDKALNHFTDNQPLNPLWELGNPDVERVASRVKSVDMGNLLTFVQLVLPGAIKFYYGEELGMRNVPDAPFPNKGLMQWSAKENGGFSSNAQPMYKIDKDFKTVNYEAQYSTPSSPLKTFQKLALLRTRDETLITGETHLSPLQGDTLLLSRVLKTGNDTYGEAFVAIANFGDTPSEVSLTTVLPDGREVGDSAQIIAVTANTNDLKARQKMNIEDGKVTVQAMTGLLLKF